MSVISTRKEGDVLVVISNNPPVNALGHAVRAGLADVRQTRSGDNGRNRFTGLFGLGLVVKLAPAVGLELAWDVTGGEGRDSGTTTGAAVSLGLRVGF